MAALNCLNLIKTCSFLIALSTINQDFSLVEPAYVEQWLFIMLKSKLNYWDVVSILTLSMMSGLIWSQLTLLWKVGGEGGASTFVTTYRLYHTTGPMSEGIYIENMFDFGLSPNYRDREVVMRFVSDIKNGRSFYTDQSGLGVIRRDWVESLSLSGNHYPITQATYLQDSGHRLTLVVDHATGASSVQEGTLEVMVDRRTMYDDARGMGEGVTDSRATTHGYWLLLEPRDPAYTPGSDLLPELLDLT